MCSSPPSKGTDHVAQLSRPAVVRRRQGAWRWPLKIFNEQGEEKDQRGEEKDQQGLK